MNAPEASLAVACSGDALKIASDFSAAYSLHQSRIMYASHAEKQTPHEFRDACDEFRWRATVHRRVRVAKYAI